jgi:hypothetical protein
MKEMNYGWFDKQIPVMLVTSSACNIFTAGNNLRKPFVKKLKAN